VTQLADTSSIKSQRGCGLAVILHVGANVEKSCFVFGSVETGMLTWIQICCSGTEFCNLPQFWLLTELSIYDTLHRY